MIPRGRSYISAKKSIVDGGKGMTEIGLGVQEATPPPTPRGTTMVLEVLFLLWPGHDGLRDTFSPLHSLHLTEK